MELKEIKLKSMQEIQSINIEPADNGGCVLRYSIYTPSAKNSDSVYDSKTELFDEDEIDVALDRVRNLYKANISAKKSSRGSTEDVKSMG